MAEAQDYREALRALLEAIASPSDGLTLSWLGAEIQQELVKAESEAREAWVLQHSESPEPSEGLLPPDAQLTIAFQVMYHELVSVPRMLAHVHRFWGRHQTEVRLLRLTTPEPIPIQAYLRADASEFAVRWLRSMLQTLTEQFGLDLSARDLLHRLEEQDEH